MGTLEFLRNNVRWLSAGSMLTFLSSFGQTFFIALFAGEISKTFDLSPGQWGGIYTLGTTASAIVMVWAGGLSDILRARTLGTIVLAALSLSCLAMAFNESVFMLPIVIFALRFTGQGMAVHLAFVAMARWYVATRGRALAVAALGFSIGEAILPLIFVSLMTVFAWQNLWIAVALFTIAVIPLFRWLLTTERTPQSMAQETQSTGMQDRHWTRNEALRHPLFWFMIPALLGPPTFNTAFFFHQVHYTEINGFSHIYLVALFPIYTSLVVLSMMISGWALDKFGTERMLPIFLLPMAVGFTIFGFAPSLTIVMVGLIFVGFTNGANSTLINAFWAEFYGTAHIGSIKALATSIMVFGSAIGPGITGLFIDFGFDLWGQYIFGGAYFVFASLMAWFGLRHVRSMAEVSS